MDQSWNQTFRRAVMEEVTAGRSVAVARSVVRNVHGPGECAGPGCWVHGRPSAWPLAWAPIDHVTARPEFMPGTRFVRFCGHDRVHEDRDAAWFRVEVQGGDEEPCDCACRCCEGSAMPELEPGQVRVADVDELAAGVWEIVTFSGSVYRLDGPGMAVARMPAGAAQPLESYDGSRGIERLGGPIVTGRPALFWVWLPGHPTARYLLTSPVVKLARVNSADRA